MVKLEKFIIFFVILLMALAGYLLYQSKTAPDVNLGNDRDEHGCIGSAGYSWCEVKNKCLQTWEEPCELPPDNPATTTASGTFTEAQAKAIAEKTCIKGGEALSGGSYNEGTKTWWFDANLNATKPGCNPACVVNEETKTAEINWRCTGLIEP